jgi:hypothetical protein
MDVPSHWRPRLSSSSPVRERGLCVLGASVARPQKGGHQMEVILRIRVMLKSRASFGVLVRRGGSIHPFVGSPLLRTYIHNRPRLASN